MNKRLMFLTCTLGKLIETDCLTIVNCMKSRVTGTTM